MRKWAASVPALAPRLMLKEVASTCDTARNSPYDRRRTGEKGSRSKMPDRAAAWDLLCEYTKGKSLRQHALAVEAAMRACAARYGGGDADPEEWGIVGLLHDFDYEMFPDPEAGGHPFKGANILCGRGYSDRIIRAIMGHATYTGVPRDTDLARALFATDELCGFLVACALVRPSRSLDDLEVSSVKKKLRDKAFARTVNRADIHQGVAELGVTLDEHIRFVIDALRPVQPEIGLQSEQQSEQQREEAEGGDRQQKGEESRHDGLQGATARRVAIDEDAGEDDGGQRKE